MKRTYFNIITLIALVAGTQAQAFQYKHLDPRNWSCEGFKRKATHYGEKVANVFGYEPAANSVSPKDAAWAKVREGVYADRVLEKQKREVAEREHNRVTQFIGNDLKNDLNAHVAAIAKTCGKPDVSQALCDKALADLQQATQDASRYVEDRRIAEKAASVVQTDLAKYAKKVAHFNDIAAQGREVGRHDKPAAVQKYTPKQASSPNIEQAYNNALVAYKKPATTPSLFTSLQNCAQSYFAEVSQDWEDRKKYDERLSFVNDSITRTGLGVAMVGTALAARKVQSLRKAWIHLKAYGSTLGKAPQGNTAVDSLKAAQVDSQGKAPSEQTTKQA
jgi:hypothetical protein